jgi:ribokinase
MAEAKNEVAILGVFVADVAFRADRLPAIGETILGRKFKLGPGGKGSNQAVAAARAGARVTFICRVGEDEFGAIAKEMWRREKINAALADAAGDATGAAFIYVNEKSGENAIIVVPGAAGAISPADVEAAAASIRNAAVFVTQFEQDLASAFRGLGIAREAGIATILNPAPAAAVDEAIYKLCDFVTPNESEAALSTGLLVESLDDARRAGDWFLARGAGTALITLGAAGSLFHARDRSVHVPAYDAGAVVETTGAGDAFNGAFAAALAGGAEPLAAAHFASAAAGISVTRAGTAPSMPRLAEIEALLSRSPV